MELKKTIKPLPKGYTDTPKKKYGEYDSDMEHSARECQKYPAPPRVINPTALWKQNITIPSLNLIYNLLKNDLPSMDGTQDGDRECDVLRGNFCKKIPEKDGKYGDLGKAIKSRQGGVELMIDIAPGKIFKDVKDCKESSQRWSLHFFLIFQPILDNFIEDIFPHYLHFILKNSPIVPLPFPYMEFFLKAEHGNLSNVMSDFSYHDYLV